METFKRRIYSISGFVHDLVVVVKGSGLAIHTMWGNTISPQFRQRLMLAVTGVNGCRYCTYLHSREALRAGLTQEEIKFLLGGLFENVPEQEVKALLYAQHWADTNAQPDAQTRSYLYETYGAKKYRVMEMALLLIRIGNLCGNSFDYFLFKLSNGRWGLTDEERNQSNSTL